MIKYKKELLADLATITFVVGLLLFFGSSALFASADYFRDGLRYYYREQFEPALEKFQQAIELEPSDPRHHFFVANSYKHLGQFDKAEIAYREALELSPDYITARRRLAFLYFDNGRWEKAQEEFEQLTQDAPGEFEYRHHYAITLYQLDQIERAREEFYRARELRPDSPEVFYYLGRISLDRGEYINAVSRFDRAVDGKSGEGRYHFHRGLAFFRMEDYLEPEVEVRSVPDFRKAIEYNFDTERSRFLLANSLLCWGLRFVRDGQTQDGIDYLREAVRLFRTVLVADPEASNAYHNLGLSYLGIGNLDLAVEALREAVELEPEVAFFHDSLGLAQFRRGDFRRAVTAWQFVTEINPQYTEHPMHELLGIEPFEDRKQEARIRQ